MSAEAKETSVQLDLSDLDRWVGSGVCRVLGSLQCHRHPPLGAGHGLPESLHWDEEFAAIRSSAVSSHPSPLPSMDYGHGCHPPASATSPAPTSFSAARSGGSTVPIRPGDKLFQDRRFDGYNVGHQICRSHGVPRGDTVHRNQHGPGGQGARHGHPVPGGGGKEARNVHGAARPGDGTRSWRRSPLRSTGSSPTGRAGRHLREVRWATSCRGGSSAPTPWSPSPSAAPSTEYLGHLALESARRGNDPATEDAGFTENMSYDYEARKIDPRMGDGLLRTLQRSHQPDKAENIGMGGVRLRFLHECLVRRLRGLLGGARGLHPPRQCQFRSPPSRVT